jgi:hypothetical protein
LEEIRRDINKRTLLGLENDGDFKEAIKEACNHSTQNTGREGLSGPSQLGVVPTGLSLATETSGGGYYFVPPIPDKKYKDIANHFSIFLMQFRKIYSII